MQKAYVVARFLPLCPPIKYGHRHNLKSVSGKLPDKLILPSERCPHRPQSRAARSPIERPPELSANWKSGIGFLPCFIPKVFFFLLVLVLVLELAFNSIENEDFKF